MAKSKTNEMQVVVGSVAMTDHADMAAETTHELLYGETVQILSTLEDEEGYPWIEAVCTRDDYKGCLPVDALSSDLFKATHFVNALRSFVYSEPDFKTLPILALSLGSQVETKKEEHKGFIKLQNNGWIWKEHLLPLSQKIPNYIDMAKRFIGTPYLWGGRTSFGLDCSALVQLSMQAAGYDDCPRDSGDQEIYFSKKGKCLDKKELLQSGDLVFFKGHVGFMIDSKHLLNATARTMDTRIEKLSEVVKHYDKITNVIRL